MADYDFSSGCFGGAAAGSARKVGCEELWAGHVETGISGSGGGGAYSALCAPFSPLAGGWGSYRALGPISPRPGGGGGARFFLDTACEDEPRHFLDVCSLCKKPLGRNRDIYMYRGDVPFCSEECRQEQIEIDEAREKNWSVSMKASASRSEQGKQKGKASQRIRARAAGTVVAG